MDNLLKYQKRQDQNSDNSYYYENTKILKNKLNLKDYNELQKHERNIVARKLAFLHIEPIKGNFDRNHLTSIHKFLFESLYYFAGTIRDCDISKKDKNGNPTIFCRPFAIEEQLNILFKNMKKDILLIKNRNDYIKFLSHYYSELNIIHAFREGNGRTNREFFRELVLYLNNIITFDNYDLDYSKMDPNDFLDGTIKSIMNSSDLLESEFDKALTSIIPDNLKKI